MAKGDSIFERLGVTPEHLMGYIYAGMLSALYSAIIARDELKQLIESLGSILSVAAFLAIGVGIYTIHRKFIGEWLLYPLHHLFHYLLDRFRGYAGYNCTSSTTYLGYLGVKPGQRRAAYDEIRTFFFPETRMREIHLAHGELHVLYLTALESFACFVYILSTGHQTRFPFLLISVVFYLAGLLGDVRQHSIETYMLKSTGEDKIKTFLADAGYISGIAK